MNLKNKISVYIVFILIIAACQALPVFAADDEEPQPQFAKSIMDGVVVEAVELYPNVNRSEFSLGFGIYPFDPYYNAFAVNGSYAFAFSRGFSWEILEGNYMYTVSKDLREELASRFGVNPKVIERPTLGLSTNAVWTYTYGKFVFMDDKIRFFKTGIVTGGGLFQTTTRNYPTINLGMRLDVYVNQSFSWKIEVRDHVAITGGFNNYVLFNILGTLSF